MSARGIHKLSVLAVAMTVSESAVSRWRGGGPINLENAIGLSIALDVSLDWLLLGRGEMDWSRSGSREVCGRLPPHLRDKLEDLVAAFLEAH